MSKASKLRFGALIRVSTEKQEKTGESLRTQRTENERSATQLGGKIVGWYGGQEHATPGFEKKEVDRLLQDAAKGKFDAIIVANADRWSRDNEKSQSGLDILQDNRVRFFVGVSEYDLFNPEHRLFLGMSAVIGRFQAHHQKRKSLSNRIERAKRGVPACGKLPFGRIFDKQKEQWRIDVEKQRLVKDVAKRYLAGEKMSDLAAEYGINHSALHKVMTQRCGNEWEMEFKAEDLNIHEVVKISIPALLPESTINALRKRAAANRTFDHGQAKPGRYLLTGFLFCEHCGFSLSGTPNAKGLLYYRHSGGQRQNSDCPRKMFAVRADQLEAVVLRHLFDCFGNPKAIQEAVEKATPNLKRIKQYRERLNQLDESIAKLRTGKARILRLITKGTIGDDEAEAELDEIKRTENRQLAEFRRLKESLDNSPSAESIKAMAANLSAKFIGSAKPKKSRATESLEYGDAVLAAQRRSINRNFDAMTWDERRALVKAVFSGETEEGKPMGVYIRLVDGEENRRRKRWAFFIRGQLVRIAGTMPWSDNELAAYFDFSAKTADSLGVVESALCPRCTLRRRCL